MKTMTTALITILIFLSATSFSFASENAETLLMEKLEQQNPQLLLMKAAGDCTTTCSTNYYYPYDQVCKTSCADGSGSSYGGGGQSCGGKAAFLGCLTGGLIGSLGEPIGTAMSIGCVVGGGLYYAISPACE